MRQFVGGRETDRQAASTSQMGRFETEILTTSKNLKALMNLPGMWVDRIRQRRSLDKLTLDLDSSASETCGRQEGSAYNGHFECTCYHPIFCFCHMDGPERVLLRNGNVASKDRGQVDPAFLPRLREQSGTVAIVRPGLQPGQLPASAGFAEKHEDLDDDDAADEADQDRSEVVHHARSVIFQMAEVAVPRRRFAAILDRIQRLHLCAEPAMAPA